VGSLENSRKLLGEKRGHLLLFAPLLALRKLGGVPFFPFGWWSGHFHSSARTNFTDADFSLGNAKKVDLPIPGGRGKQR